MDDTQPSIDELLQHGQRCEAFHERREQIIVKLRLWQARGRYQTHHAVNLFGDWLQDVALHLSWEQYTPLPYIEELREGAERMAEGFETGICVE
jgi:hypothetical protein